MQEVMSFLDEKKLFFFVFGTNGSGSNHKGNHFHDIPQPL
jgi:hypothetical protein